MNPLKKTLKNIYKPISKFLHETWAIIFPASYAKYVYKMALGKKLNLKNPMDLNEKIQWLKIYSDTSSWTVCADKYLVRKYVEDKGFQNILVKTYGVWDNALKIDFNDLPEQFVLKTNHGFGKNILVKDKRQLNISETQRQLNHWLRTKYGLISFEPHSWKIKRKIIAEELLEEVENQGFSNSLIDYKFWCFHGEPYLVMVLFNRQNRIVGGEESGTKTNLQACIFDLNWNLQKNALVGKLVSKECQKINKPRTFDQMISVCRSLAKPFPQVRVDLYEVNYKLYFGELTFTSMGGYMNYFSPDYLKQMGMKIDLLKAPIRTKSFVI